jgi:superfamily II DNA or RNA helicase
MEEWVERYRKEAERLIRLGRVREIDFSGATYQVEVYDPETGESRWPFLQLDDAGGVKDAFCSCPAENGKCLHLAAAYLKILDPQGVPLHQRFESSFWNHLCRLLGDHSGYEERFLQKKGEGHYLYQNDVLFQIKAKTKGAKQYLAELIESRLRETPENSIKFSNLSQEEIGRWREGRASPPLRYALSFWSDLAKWMMRETDEGRIQFEEDSEGFPTILETDFPSFAARFELKKKDLPKLIPSLEGVKSPLKVFQLAEEEIKKITFDPRTLTFHIEHLRSTPTELGQKALILEGWAYQQGVGFYPQDGGSLLGRTHISKEEIPQFLENFHTQIARYIPIHDKRLLLGYSMHFDEGWNWHFTAYLFEKGDLSKPSSALIGNWVYLGEKGFYPIEDPFFEHIEAQLFPSEVSRFVNHHRIWLNGQEGFQTHLASIESHLTYTVTEGHTLRFHTKKAPESADMMDFGDWIYYAGLGFFSKKHARLGIIIRPGLEVPPAEISQFIKANREELETIPRFFTPICPLAARGLEITPHLAFSVQVKPVYTLLSEYQESQVYLFGDFAYLKGEGFCELPAALRLPDQYLTPLTFPQANLPSFFESELPFLMKYCKKIDPSLLSPHKLDFVIHYLVRTGGGGLKAQLFYQTELGKVAATELLEAIENKKRYCFTEAGLIDLHSHTFQWMRHFKNLRYPETQMLELSTLELIRLDTTFGLLGPSENTSTAQVTRNLLKELREFSSHESPNLKGLTSSLRLYQQTGLQWLWFLYKNGLSGLLCDDMGLGKTHQAMALIAATLNQKSERGRLYLVVCPTSVIYHWQDKLEIFLPHVKVHTFHGLKRSLKRLPNEGLILTSYGILRMERKKFEQIDFEVAIFDEVQIAKNPHSRVHEALKAIRSRMCVGLTGTPIENNLRELKALFDIVLPGYMPSEARYRELFITPIERDFNEEQKALLSQMIRPFILRRRKTEVLQELPEKSEDKSYCDLSDDQVKLYKQILSQTRDTLITELRDQTVSINYVHIFSLLSQLKQVCNHPALIYKDPKNYQAYTSGKWDLFVELLEEARESEQKVVIFSQYLYMLDIIENYLQKRGWGYAQIRGDTVNRREELKRFQEDLNCVVFIGSLQAAGLGIDLTAASVVIMYDRWWNKAREDQAIDRVHRIGQKWGVQVYKLITKNTIEEKIDRMITRKGRLLEEVVSADDQAVFKKFSRSELIELLTF